MSDHADGSNRPHAHSEEVVKAIDAALESLGLSAVLGNREESRHAAPKLGRLPDLALVELQSLFNEPGGDRKVRSAQFAVQAEIDLRCSRRAEEQARALVDATSAFREAMEAAADAAADQERRLARLGRWTLFWTAVLGAALGAAFGVMASLMVAHLKG